jgi:hypothetical protein
MSHGEQQQVVDEAARRRTRHWELRVQRRAALA